MMCPCAHCGTPTVSKVDQDSPVFCCMGCEQVYQLIQGSGLGTFYDVKKFGESTQNAPPVISTDVDAQAIEHMDVTTDEAGNSTATMRIEGMHCAGCVWLIEQLPFQVEGVQHASVSWSAQTLTARWQSPGTLLHIARWIAHYGYQLHPMSKTTTSTKPMLRRMAVAWAVACNIMLLSISHYAGMGADDGPIMFHGARIVCAGLATVTLFYGSDIFIRRAFLSLKGSITRKQLRWSMDVPLALGVLLMWVVSMMNTIRGSGDVWFDSMAMLTAALLTARWLQQRANIQARNASSKLYELLPKTARLLTPGDSNLIDAEMLVAGMHVEVRAGELFPADGQVISGESMIHRGIFTGESHPQPLLMGQDVEAGVQNIQDTIVIEVHQTGKQTHIGQLQTWVKSHADRRAPLDLMIDRYGSWFVLIVVMLATATMITTHIMGIPDGLQRAVAILVVSCPCALAMSTPLTMAMAMGQSAQRGIFIKYDDVIETLEHVDTIIFDKTGTLTHGQLNMVAHEGDFDPIIWAAALEYGDNHPIARGIYKSVTVPMGLAIRDIIRTPGAGVEGHVEGHHIKVGAPSWVAPNEASSKFERTEVHARHTPIDIAVDGVLTTRIWLGDRPRQESKALVQTLLNHNINVMLLSGDDAKTVASTADIMGIKQALGQMSHKDKCETIESLQQQGHRVMMVGDGVNDAQALQIADVGVAMEGSAQISLVACDVFLHQCDIDQVFSLWLGAKKTMRTVRLTVASSGAYNLFAITLAMFGYMSPLGAAILMPISSLIVVLMACSSTPFSKTKPMVEQALS